MPQPSNSLKKHFIFESLKKNFFYHSPSCSHLLIRSYNQFDFNSRRVKSCLLGKMKFFIFLIFTYFASEANGAKILGVFPFPSKSHSILGQALFVELSNRGHEVTYLSPYPFKSPPNENYRDIAIKSEEFVKVFEEEMNKVFEVISLNFISTTKMWIEGRKFFKTFFKEKNNFHFYVRNVQNAGKSYER